MPAELSIIITGLQKEGASVVHSGKVNAEKVAELLDARIAPLVPEGEPRPDFLAVQKALVWLAEDQQHKLLEFDASYVAELTATRTQRRERDLAFDELTEMLSEIRDACEGVHGTGSSDRLFDGVTRFPQDPVALQRFGARVQDHLANAEFELPPVKLAGGQPFERAALATALGQKVDRLRLAVAAVGLEVKGSETSLHEKSEALEEYRRTVRFVAGGLRAFYGLVGLDALAEKVRPKRRAARSVGDGNGDGDTPAEEATADSGDNTPAAAGTPAGDGDDHGPVASGPIGIVS